LVFALIPLVLQTEGAKNAGLTLPFCSAEAKVVRRMMDGDEGEIWSTAMQKCLPSGSEKELF
jgi:hypothetical protein